MPCDTIQRTTIVFGENTDKKMLFRALERMKLSPRFNSDGSKIMFSGGTFDVASGEVTTRSGDPQGQLADMRQHYGAAITLDQCEKYGWQVEETSPFQFQVTKGY